jgi:hypothetical protein
MASSAAFELVLELNDKASKGLGQAAKQGGFLKNALSFATGGAILGGIQAIGGAAKDMFTDAIDEAKEWNTGLGQLDAVLTSTGGKVGLTKDQLLDLNKALSAGGGFSAAADDAVLTGQNMLLTFTNIGKDVFPTATKAMPHSPSFARSGGICSPSHASTPPMNSPAACSQPGRESITHLISACPHSASFSISLGTWSPTHLRILPANSASMGPRLAQRCPMRSQLLPIRS